MFDEHYDLLRDMFANLTNVEKADTIFTDDTGYRLTLLTGGDTDSTLVLGGSVWTAFR
jgi:hypothetical protein